MACPVVVSKWLLYLGCDFLCPIRVDFSQADTPFFFYPPSSGLGRFFVLDFPFLFFSTGDLPPNISQIASSRKFPGQIAQRENF